MARSSAKPAVMHDVARLAGVSHQTVSRVLNDHPNVAASTRDRVLQAIEQLDYRPNQMARGLVTRRSGRIGVLTPESLLFGPTSSLLGIEQAARQAGYSVTVTVIESSGAGVKLVADAMADQALEGVLVIAPSEAAAKSVRNLSALVPVVAVEARYDGEVPCAAVNQFVGAQLATQHLLDLGHETVWQVAGPDDWVEARDRIEGWRATLSDAGVAAPPLLRGDWSAASGYQAALDLAARPNVTAVFAANDQMAVGLLNGLHQAGLRVPEDVSVVGFDDIPEAAYLIPPLTTIRQDFVEIGKLGVRLLTDLINGTTGGQDQLTVDPELVIRASTAPPNPGRRPAPHRVAGAGSQPAEDAATAER
jgi:DNA-binding LacI/PurR family transcriptional regulator